MHNQALIAAPASGSVNDDEHEVRHGRKEWYRRQATAGARIAQAERGAARGARGTPHGGGRSHRIRVADPVLGPLIRLARALGVRLGTFLDDQENVGPVFVHAGERRKVMHVSDKSDTERSDLDFFSLAANKAGGTWSPS